MQFGPGDLSGFTSTGLTGFQDLNPSAVVRELVQNSLDAAVEVKEPTAHICFELDSCDLAEIPGITEYRQALNRAKKSHSRDQELPDQARAVVDVMEDCLRRPRCDVLTVSDNGIGLDRSRMRALLGDGISVKAQGATGAFGNGHVVAIPASDLRYVLYGGVSKGQEIASGHAILAAHEDGEQQFIRSKDGFFVEALNTGNFATPFKFVTGSGIPELVRKRLKEVRDKWSHGTAVIIPGFNRFREDSEPIWEPISKAVACSFFAAIQYGALVVEVIEDDASKVLDAASLSATLEHHSDERRSTGSFLTGSRAYEALRTLKEGRRLDLTTAIGDATCYVRVLSEGGVTRTNLCRNGMWVTDDLPGFYGHFSEKAAFEAVILLDSKTGMELHRLVRKAEGPLHNGLSSKFLDKAERNKFRSAFAEIRSRLKEAVPSLDQNEYRPNDVFTVETPGDASVASGRSRPSIIGQATVVPARRSSTLGSRAGMKGKKKGKKKPQGKRGGNPLQFQALPVPTGPRSYRVEILPEEDCAGSELRIALDENLDVTCDAMSFDTLLAISRARLDQRDLAGGDLLRGIDGQANAVVLGSLTKGRRYVVDLDFALPRGFVLPDDQTVVLKVEVVRRAAAESEEAA